MTRSSPGKITVFPGALIISCSLFASLLAEKKEGASWEHSAAAGFSLATGNSDSLAYHIRFLGTYRDLRNDAHYGADYYYSEDSDITTNNSLRVYGSNNFLISERFYLGLNASLLTNEASLLDYRFDINPVIGYYFMRDSRKLLSIEAGPGYAFESKDGESDSFATMRLAQHFDYRWDKMTRIRQSASLTPKIEDPASYIFEFSAGLDLRINDRWDIQPRVIHRVDLSPVFGREEADTLITVGLAYSLNGFLKEEVDRADKRKTLKRKTLKTEGNRKGWVRNVGLGVSSTSGNSDTLNLNLNYESIYRSDDRDLKLKGDYRFAEKNGSTSQNKLNLSASHSWKFDKAIYTGIGTHFSYDDSIDLNYRITPGIHAGYYPILTDYGGLSFEAGLGYTFQEEGGIVTDAPSFHLAQRLYWQLGYHTYLTQEVSYQAFIEDPGNFNISSYLYLDTFLTENLSWRVGMQYYFDSQPPSGKDKDDFSFLSGISVRF